MKINKLCIILLCSLIASSSCGSFKDGLVGSKRSKSSDEFFVKKKSPLILPPDYGKLPIPNPEEKKTVEDETKIEDLFDINKEQSYENSNASNNKSLEDSILEKIKKE